MAGTIVVDRLESDASYASSINVASQIQFSNTVRFSNSDIILGNTGNRVVTPGFNSLTVRGPDGSEVFFGNNSVTTGRVSGTPTEVRITASQPSAVITFMTNSTERIRIPSDAGGIKFPATQNASSDANTLDDYEEGTFTPTYLGGSSAGTTSYNDRNGFYTKIGNLVTFTIYIAPASSTGTGSIFIGGLPFASQSGTNGDTFTVMVNALDWSAGSYIVGYLGTGGTIIVPYGCSDNAGWAALNITNASVTFYISGSYRTAT